MGKCGDDHSDDYRWIAGARVFHCCKSTLRAIALERFNRKFLAQAFQHSILPEKSDPDSYRDSYRECWPERGRIPRINGTDSLAAGIAKISAFILKLAFKVGKKIQQLTLSTYKKQ